MGVWYVFARLCFFCFADRPRPDARILSMVKRHFNKEGRLEAAIAYHKTVSTPKEAAAVYDALNTTDVRCPVLFIGGEDDSGGGCVILAPLVASHPPQ